MISVLGPLDVVHGGEPVRTFASKKVQALLAYLAVESDRAHARPELMALLWPDFPEDSARKSLRHALWNLRDAIDDREADVPRLLATRDTIRFNPQSDYELDVAFLTAPPPAGPLNDELVGRLEAALARAREPLLAGFALPDSEPFEEWLLLKREFYAQRASVYYARLTDHLERSGDYAATLVHARHWLELDPWREIAHQQIMRALALQGDRAQAMAQFEHCRQILDEELGVEPSDDTVALAERIRRGELTPTVAPAAQAPAPAPIRHQVQRLLTQTVGRDQELRALHDLFADPGCRLVTIVGPGGMGKTHLAMEFAARYEVRLPAGAAVVALAGVQAAEGLPAAVAHALNLSSLDERVPVERQVQEYLAARRMLLVLDNFEHLLDGVALVEAWLRAAPGLLVLATSRLRLEAHGEQLLPLAGLPVPPASGTASARADAADYASVAFFLQCAQRVRPRRRLTGNHPDMAHVHTICRLLDGMPLAIMLAASWVESLTLEEIAAELGRGLDLLQSDDRTLAPRHQDIKIVFAQAWSFLADDEQRVLAQLSVFRGGCTRTAATAIAGATLTQLRGLTRKFLLNHSVGGRGVVEGRFGMHELVRQFAAHKLADLFGPHASTAARHAEYFVEFLAQRDAELKGKRQMQVLAEIDADSKNIAAAWGWVCAHDVTMLTVPAVDAMGRFYAWNGRYIEGEVALQTALEQVVAAEAGAASVEFARLHSTLCRWMAHFHFRVGKRGDAERTLAHGLARLDSVPSAAEDLRVARAALLCEWGMNSDDFGLKNDLFSEAVALLRDRPPSWDLADALRQFGHVLVSRPGTDEVGQAVLEESRQLFERFEDHWSLSDVMAQTAFAAMLRGDHRRGIELARRIMTIAQETATPVRIQRATHVLKYSLQFAGEYEEALVQGYAGLETARTLGDQRAISVAHFALAVVQLHLGRYDDALDSVASGFREDSMRVLGLLSYGLWFRGEALLAQRKYADAARDLRQSVEMHRQTQFTGRLHDVLAAVGYAAFALGDDRLLYASLAECAASAGPDHLWLTATRSIVLAALAALMEREYVRAVELYALASTARYVAASVLFEEVAGRHVRQAAAQLPPDVAAAAEQRGANLDLWETVTDVARRYAAYHP